MANNRQERHKVERILEERILSVFQGEVGRQCKFVLIALDEMRIAYESRSIDRFWYSVQSFLDASGNISKLLWPPNKKYDGRGLELRKSLDVREASPLRPRDFRNHFEHFDERLEDWVTSSKRHNIVDSSIFPAGKPFIVGIDERDFLRNYHQDTMTVSFRGDEYRLIPLVEEIQKLLAKTVQVDEARMRQKVKRVPQSGSEKNRERVP